MPTDRKRGLVIIVLVAVAAVIIGVSQITRYLHSGRIAITADTDSATITLRQISGDEDDSDDTDDSLLSTITAHATLAATVPLGQYVAAVQDGSSDLLQLISLTSHANLHYTLNPAPLAGNLEPVINRNAQSVVADHNRLVYLDNGDGHLYQIDGTNSVTIIAPNQTFRSVQWANANLGIGKGNDRHLYLIEGTMVTPLPVPFAYGGGQPVSSAIAPNGRIYVSDGPQVYTGSKDSSFHKLYKAKIRHVGLLAGPQQLLVNQSAGEESSDVVAVSPTGKVTPKHYDLGQTAWSPDGHYLASTTETGGNLYDTRHGTSILLPQPTGQAFIGSFSWSNNQTVLYTTAGSELWSYNVDSRQARLLTNLPGGTTATYISVDGNGAYAYLLSGNSSGITAIQRLGLRAQSPSPTVFQLQDVVSRKLNSCSLGLANFAAPPALPALLVQVAPGADPAPCLQAAQTRLQIDGLSSTVALRSTILAAGQ